MKKEKRKDGGEKNGSRYRNDKFFLSFISISGQQIVRTSSCHKQRLFS